MNWAEEEFSAIDLGDARLNKRTALLAERLARSPATSIPQACNGSHETQAAYRFFDHESVDFWSVMEPHFQCTLKRMSAQPVVLCLQDTTSLDFNGKEIEGLGPPQYKAQSGMLLHPSYAVTPSREPLGLIDSWHWTREARKEDGKRPESINESDRWVEGYERIGELASELPDTRCVYVGDRESDIVALMRRANELGHPADWLVRASHNRALPEGKKLFEEVGAGKPLGVIRFVLPARKNTKARNVEQTIHAKRISIKDGKRGIIQITCVIARENNPPAGKKAMQWKLLTNRGVTELDQASELIDWYRARWEIKMFFDVLKNGCQIETLQLKTMERLEVALAIYLIVAWRINRLMRLGRECPDMDAMLVFDEDEIRAAYAINKKRRVKGSKPGLNEVVRLIAMAGGFLARKSDGQPGAKALWRGIDKVLIFAEGLRYARDNPEYE